MSIFLCALCNVSSGSCSEDCKFCTQSAHYNADIQKYKFKDIKQIVKEGVAAKQNGATGYCLVTSGKGLNDKTLDFICRAIPEVRKELGEDFNIITCNGTASLEQLKELKKAGATAYNHNLETSREFYPQICTTHPWEERFKTALAAKEAGLNLVCGGIFGLGESESDRISFVNSLKELAPMTVPLNFFHPNIALPLHQNYLSTDEGLALIKWVKKELPDVKKLMIAGGRELIFGSRQNEIFGAGANAIVIGDYLTTSGNKANKDTDMLKQLGLKAAKTHHG